jgi:hypothetical protein
VLFACAPQSWFEAFVMCNILLIGVATGLDLEFEAKNPAVNEFVSTSSTLTMIVFTLECVFKIIAEGFNPMVFFTHEQNGHFNTFGEVPSILRF